MKRALIALAAVAVLCAALAPSGPGTPAADLRSAVDSFVSQRVASDEFSAPAPACPAIR